MEAVATTLVKNGLKFSTQKTYASAQKQYIDFCDTYGYQVIPSSEQHILLFIAYLYKKRFPATSIRVYLSAVRSLHLQLGYKNPSEDSYRIKQALKAIERSDSKPKQKLPITYEILCRWKPFFDVYNPVHRMWWAMFTLAHFALLRAAEFTIPNQSVFTVSQHLVNSDVKFQVIDFNVKYMILHLKQSKTDTKGTGVDIYIGCTGTTVCAYCAMAQFISQKTLYNDKTSPLFIFPNGTHITKNLLSKTIKLYMSRIGLDPSSYSGHSFRIGGATTMASRNFADWEIKMGGRWSSEAYQRYIRVPVPQLVQFAKRMALQSNNNTSEYSFTHPYVLE